MSRAAIDHEHDERSRVLADAVARQSRIAQMAAGTELGSIAERRAKILSRRMLTENARYFDAVTSTDYAAYWAWRPSWWRNGSLVAPR